MRGGRPLGWAFYSDKSQIALRMLTRGETPADDALVRKRIADAVAFRRALQIDATAYRLIHGEADLLPSLVVDRYGDYLVVQALCQGMDRRRRLVVSVLQDVLQPKGILARNDPRTRSLEGLEQKVEVLAGDVPESIGVTENGIRYDVDVRRGQKTGLFLDQRENRAAAALYAHGRLLDCFTYTGGFALHVAKCREVIAHDVSEDAIAHVKQERREERVTVDARVGNVFDELRGLERLRRALRHDRPTRRRLRRTRRRCRTRRRGKEINPRALKLLNPGGILVTCSCSHTTSTRDVC
jgi:23S rRNA (cytosine1962-C5)-methyltransferase